MFEKYAVKELVGYHKGLYGIRWNKEGDYLGAICGDRAIRIAQIVPHQSSVEIVHTIPTTATMAQLCWNPTETNRLAFCNDDKSVEIWDLRATRPAMKMQSLGGNINLDWSGCGNYIAIGNKSDNICVMDVRTGNICKKKKFQYEVNELAWTYNSDFILTASNAEGFGSIDVLSFKSEEELELIDSVMAHASNCFHLKIDPTFQRLGVSSNDQCLSIWDLKSMISTCTFTLDFSFNGDGRYVSIVCDDPSVLICDCDEGMSVAKISTRVRNHMVAWNPKHQHIIASMHENRSSNTSQFLKLLVFPKE